MQLAHLRSRGRSMSPWMKSMDRVFALPCEGPIRRGDVVLFRRPGDGHLVIHRVVHADADGVRTRGDGNDYTDRWVLRREDILGRVAYVMRGKRRIPIAGGWTGRCLAAGIRWLRFLKARIFPRLRPFYEGLLSFGFCKNRIWFRKKMRVISFERSGGTELQLMMGRRMIGRRRAGGSRWEISRPFDLFVDEGLLPDHPSST